MRNTIASLIGAIALFSAAQAGAAEFVIQHGKKSASPYFSGAVVKSLPLSRAFVADLSEDEAARLIEEGYVVEKNVKVSLHPFQVEGAAPSDWPRKLIRADVANRLPRGKGEGVTVCVVDSGVNDDHPMLKGKVVGGRNTENPATPNDYSDPMGHGTPIAALIAGRRTRGFAGVAPAAQVYAVRALAENGSGTLGSVIEGLRACIGNSDVVSMSFGGAGTSQALAKALEDVHAAGITLVAAAGNSGGNLTLPASHGNVVSVTSVNRDRRISRFTCRGPELDFAAPGEQIPVLGENGEVLRLSGTSFAAALVAGVEAIRISRRMPQLRARDLGFPRPEQGDGLIDAFTTAGGE